ncbi:glycosyltransferase family protein [Cumulibacter manganitolerans]|uniref:glycosyltransferase family protein n=1 Tax=Cumulibacter manganitolerans TaxID=1884992 RepID=UPI0012970023|nr:glycosyltransferase [Cumulibacter manganitolerans]
MIVRNLAPPWFGTEQPLHRDGVDGGDGGKLKIIHGKASSGNGTLQVIDALISLPTEYQHNTEVLMLEVASTPESIKERVAASAADLPPGTLKIIPGIPHEAMGNLLAQFDVGLISYQRDLGYESLPNRLFEYMAAGLATLAPSYSPEIVKILDSEGIGVALDFESSQAIATAIRWCQDHLDVVRTMGVRARSAYFSRYTWDTEAERLIAAMSETRENRGH